MSLNYSWIVKEPPGQSFVYNGVNPPVGVLTSYTESPPVGNVPPNKVIYFKSRHPYAAEYYLSKYKTLGTSIGTGSNVSGS